MKKFLLTLVFFLSFAAISRSDPPAGYTYDSYYFVVKNWQGQFITGATVSISDMSWVDMNASLLTSDAQGNITIRFIVPSDPDVLPPSFNGIQVTFSATGYQDAVYYLDSHRIISIIMESSL